MSAQVPAWAQRIRSMREAKDWTQVQAVEEMRSHTEDQLPSTEAILRRWKDWEAGRSEPGGFYRPIIAATLGTVTSALFPPENGASSALDVVTATGMDTLEIVSRLQMSDVNEATLEAVRITVDKLCSDYARQPPGELIMESKQWLRRLVEMQENNLTFRQHRDTLELAGWLTLLVGCLEYDMGDRRRAEATRQYALKIGQDVDHPGIMGWAHEMQAWFALTTGDYRRVIVAGEAGEVAARDHSVGVQLIAQQAKAYARMGRRDDMLKTLERGRVTLDGMPYPDNVENHFVVDPSKYDFYAMDCYRMAGENKLATELSDEVIRVSTGFGDEVRWPMRVAEAEVTLGVVAAREGDLDEAVSRGRRALSVGRKSIPSLSFVAQDLSSVLTEQYAGESEADAYLEELNAVQRSR